MLSGIREILIITTPHEQDRFKELLGNGHQFGVEFLYAIQAEPNGLAEAFVIGHEFINNSPVTLILGDNLFYGSGITEMLTSAIESGVSTVFLSSV